MWRPLEIFLYDWWPIRREAQLSDRLAAMPVRIRYLNAKSPDAWKGDWPVVARHQSRSVLKPNAKPMQPRSAALPRPMALWKTIPAIADPTA